MTIQAKTVRVPAEAAAQLREADPVMRALVERFGLIEYPVDPDLWRALVGSVVGQQLSMKAAATIRARVAALGENGFPTPDRVLAIDDETLRACGLSRAKLGYIRDIARSWVAGGIRPEEIAGMADDAVIETLARLRGVGRWTAEMILIFSLGRADVLAVDDLGIRVGAHRAYGLADRPGKAELLLLGEPWRPFRTYASLYLWRSLAPG